MAESWWPDLLAGLAAALLLAWVALIAALVIVRPRDGLAREAVRLLPDVLRLLPRLAADRSLPRGIRIRLGLLLAYLAFPIDLVPDFIPVIGYADDAIIVTAAVRTALLSRSVPDTFPGPGGPRRRNPALAGAGGRSTSRGGLCMCLRF
jgi:hypothetical protein